MHASQFDLWTRRRFNLATGGAIATALGLLATGFLRGAEAKKRKRPRPNEFGCLDVGQPCGGKDGRCCSGICQGKKPKKGKRDRSRCIAHDTGGCQAGQDSDQGTLIACPADMEKLCWRTTGNGAYCGLTPHCQSCATDDDCRDICNDQAAACIVRNCGGFGPTACVAPNGCTP